jgi:hypothetical protein
VITKILEESTAPSPSTGEYDSLPKHEVLQKWHVSSVKTVYQAACAVQVGYDFFFNVINMTREGPWRSAINR